MKRSGLRRRTRLTANAPLERKTALHRTAALGRNPLARSNLHANSAAERAKPKRHTATPPRIPTRVRIALAVRSGGKCEIAAPGCTGQATEASHRVKVGAGGRKGQAAVGHHVLSNLLHVDRHCHAQHLHAEPAAAYAAGWMLREHQDPAAEPVTYRGEPRWLAEDGSVLTAPPTNAKEATRD